MADASIVFRNEDMSGTGPIYIDTLEGAAKLAAKYRNASFYVDVINGQDEVALRWEKGAPDWKLGQVKPIELDTPAYDFARKDDRFWDAEGRLRLLSEAISFAFDTAVGQANEYDFEALLAQTEHHGGNDIWSLVGEARIVAEAAGKTKSSNVWAMEIVRWMSENDRLFVRYRVEYAALSVHLSEVELFDRVLGLSVEVARLEANSS